MSAKKEEIEEFEEFDLEKGPKVMNVQRLGSDEFRRLQDKYNIEQSRERGFEKLRQAEAREDADDLKFFEKGPYQARKGIEELKEKKEREGMVEEDAKGLRDEYFEAEMEPWGQGDESGGKRRKTHRKKHYKKKTYKKNRKTSRKHKKMSSKRSTKRYRK